MKNNIRVICTLLVLALFMSALLLVSCEKKAQDSTDGGDDESGVIYSITYKGVKLVPGAPAKAAVEAIDEQYSYEEVGSCIGDGKDKRYSYSSIRIETVNNDGVDYISAVYLINDLASTDEGLTIGSAESDIKAKYGEECEVQNGVYTYTGKDKTALRIFTKDGSVSSVCYMWS
jgi:hypothetical protein